MTDDTLKPKRRRWRWIIAGVLLLTALAWWNWPRGDARFVGKWQWNAVDGVRSRVLWNVTLKLNGRALLNGPGGTIISEWTTTSDGFQLRGYPPSNGAGRLWNSYLARYVGITFDFGSWPHLKVKKVDDLQIDLVSNQFQEVILTRVSE